MVGSGGFARPWRLDSRMDRTARKSEAVRGGESGRAKRDGRVSPLAARGPPEDLQRASKIAAGLPLASGRGRRLSSSLLGAASAPRSRRPVFVEGVMLNERRIFFARISARPHLGAGARG